MSPQAGDYTLAYDTDDDLLSIPETDPPDACQQHAQNAEYLRFYDPDSSMQAVKNHIHLRFPSLSVVDVGSTASTDAQMLRSVRLVDGRRLLIHLPSWYRRPLQHELGSITQELLNICWLQSLPKYRSKNQDRGQAALFSSRPWPPIEATNFTKDVTNTNHLTGFLPIILHHEYSTSATQRSMDFEIMLSEPPLGTSIPELEEALSQRERMSCDWQTGQLFRRIASNISPTGYFGPPAHVLAEHTSMPWLSDSMAGTYLRSDIGYPSWSEAFGELFYTALEEAGRSRITLPSHKLHVAFERFRPAFDVVKRPSLVAIDGCEDSQVLVLRRKESKRYPNSKPGVSEASEDESTDDAFINIGSFSTDVKVTGLKSWGHFVFGDPLFATCFLNTASDALIKGMNTAFSADDPLGDADLVEDPQDAHIRLLFYDIVHTMRGIARQHKGIRTPDSAQKEDMWWMRLRKALAKLDDMTAEED
ncbi:uncharacterized protein F5Z01DRAFT_630183 [Emericellopsis atlantica]|uniref:Aminoglycoside phosphotransferase domain-containing protein n=1 Tax=Emericellopsis atlantica TaxID=2614577 RepID=A0A9P8CK42_9HYPO|nr:uncharacterized protein F5Z01DRAFT_630183 [Emericellopsis atlantica]KAG9250154.1 hypothetical protein F5Z01DRAFT_630183 [Emericellopsis atlantica]